jgi:glutamine cyclotransferase
VIERFPHDRGAFTQGLLYAQGYLYESTGRRGQSSLRRVDLTSGEVVQMARLGDQYFGEGLALWQDRLYQLTWTSNVGFVYDQESFEEIGRFTYPTEGWGLTHDGDFLILSDGSDHLYFYEPERFELVRTLPVRLGDRPLFQLNELEYIHGQVYANVWGEEFIVAIDLQSGQVTRWIDLRGLLPEEERAEPGAVLNGIAYDPDGDRLFVTGKLWPTLFWIELVAE